MEPLPPTVRTQGKTCSGTTVYISFASRFFRRIHRRSSYDHRLGVLPLREDRSTHHGRLQLGAAAMGLGLGCCDGTGSLPNAPSGTGLEGDKPSAAHRLTYADRTSWWRDLPPDSPA